MNMFSHGSELDVLPGSDFSIMTAAATRSPRPDPRDSQDRYYSGRGLVLLADGVGSLPRSGDAAQVAVQTCRAHLGRGQGLRRSLTEAHRRVRDRVKGAGSTTALVMHWRAGVTRVAWVGNGTVLNGSFGRDHLTGGGRVHLTALTLPQVSYRRERDVLDQSIGGLNEPVPDVLSLGASSVPQLRIAVTDGVFSPEQSLAVEGADGTHWTQVTPAMAQLQELVRAVLMPPAPPPLQPLAEEALEQMLAAGELQDDASLGLMYVPAGHRISTSPPRRLKSPPVRHNDTSRPDQAED